MRAFFAISLMVVTLFSAVSTEASWFRRDPDPDKRPNIFVRMGKGVTNSVTGLFRKKEPVVILPNQTPTPRKVEPVRPSSVLPERRIISSPPKEVPVKKPVAPAPVAKKSQSPEEYLREIQQIILKETRLPLEAKGTGIAETVRVYFVLYPSGELGKVFVPAEYRSQYGYLNEDAMATVYKASYQFKPFPPSMKASKEKLMSIEINYQD